MERLGIILAFVVGIFCFVMAIATLDLLWLGASVLLFTASVFARKDHYVVAVTLAVVAAVLVCSYAILAY